MNTLHPRTIWVHRVIALLVSLLAVWRLPYVLDGTPQDLALAQSIFGLLFVATAMKALLHSFANRKSVPMLLSYGLGFLFALFLLVGRQMERYGTFSPLGVNGALNILLTLVIFGMLLGACISVLFQKTLQFANRSQKIAEEGHEESLFSRLAGNGWLVFLLLLIAWLPVWLAFFPGTFRHDATWQFTNYVAGEWNTHHPLFHTILHGLCLSMGLKLGTMTTAVAIYSGLQMAMMAGIFAYSCHWLWRRKVPLAIRLCVIALYALLPIFPMWSFSATKDVPFGGFVLLLAMQMMDWWQDDYAALRSGRRIALFVVTGLLMMLFRHNGLYALLFAMPFMIMAAKKQRLRMSVVCACTVAIYLLCNWGMVQLLQAQQGSPVEMLSVPLQQIARVMSVSPETVSQEDQESVRALYKDRDAANFYHPRTANPNKSRVDSGLIRANPMHFVKLWLRLGIRHPAIFVEAFFVQNAAYFDPGTPDFQSFVLGCNVMEDYPIDDTSLLPRLRATYERYAERLFFLPLPGSFLLSKSASWVWVCMLCVGIQLYRKQYGTVIAGLFLLGIWLTNLLGPLAQMRYTLPLFYCIPIIAARVFGRLEKEPERISS